MKKLYSLILILFISIAGFSQDKVNQAYPALKMGEAMKVSLLTYNPGSELYSMFGHSAIRIIDPVRGTNLVYNYGTFAWDQPHFYFRFLKGNLLYSLSVVPWNYVEQNVMLENRTVIETPLNLNAVEKLNLQNFLLENLKPENRDYQYDFQYDNCATRIIDLLPIICEDSLMLNTNALPTASFRVLLDPYLENKPWIHIGIDLLMGISADRAAQFTQPAFLPDYLHLFVKNYTINRQGYSARLAQKDKVLVQNYLPPKKAGLTPDLVLWPLAILMLISVLIDSYFRPVFRFLGDYCMLIVGILGLFLLLLWLLPFQYIFNYNTDLLWANPLLLLLFLMRKKQGNLKKTLVIVSLVGTLLGVITTLVIEHNPQLTALAIILSIHLLSILRNRKTEAEISPA